MWGGGGGASSQGAWGMCFSDLTPWPQPTRVSKLGGPGGRSPHGGGLWGVPPHKTKRGGESPTLATRPRVGPKTQANPKPTGVGNGGQGAEPHGGDMGDVPVHAD